jgi:hypothetical protein
METIGLLVTSVFVLVYGADVRSEHTLEADLSVLSRSHSRGDDSPEVIDIGRGASGEGYSTDSCPVFDRSFLFFAEGLASTVSLSTNGIPRTRRACLHVYMSLSTSCPKEVSPCR